MIEYLALDDEARVLNTLLTQCGKLRWSHLVGDVSKYVLEVEVTARRCQMHRYLSRSATLLALTPKLQISS